MSDFKSKIIDYLSIGEAEIKAHYPNDDQKKTADIIISEIKRKIYDFINEKKDFGWKDFDSFCKYCSAVIDSRNQEKNATGISYELIYKKRNLEWLLEAMNKERQKYRILILQNELSEILQNAKDRNLKIDHRIIEKRNPHLYKQFIDLLKIKKEDDCSEWKGIYKYIPQDLQEVFVEKVETREEKRQKIEEENKILEDAEKVLEESKNQSTPTGKQIRALRGILGDANTMDILSYIDPRYKKVPPEKLKKIIAKVLGECYIVKGKFGRPGLIELGKLFKELPPDIEKKLLEVFKREALAFYNEQKKAGSTKPDGDIILNYLSDKEEEFNKLGFPFLKNIIESTLKYYTSALTGLKKPDYIVDYVKKGRLFPDINQHINIQEIKDKKRMLIADQMGLGKSASAILSKEILGLGTTLVVVPANVIDTWQQYLSDEIDEEGNQVGYFKKGHAPKVLTVESIDDLKNNDISSFDYVLLSHNRLTLQTNEVLQTLNFGYIIVDEVHKLKNLKHGTQSRIMLRLSKKAQDADIPLTILSGTPVPNKIFDIAMLLKLLYPKQFHETSIKALMYQIISGDLRKLRLLLLERMQAKELADSIELPELTEKITYVEANESEIALNEAIVEEYELTQMQKIHLLRMLYINPAALDTLPNTQGSKIKEFNKKIKEAFKKHDKGIAFINGYVENIFVGENSFVNQLEIPEGVEVRMIYGNISRKERKEIQNEINKSNKRLLILVSGQTADVGVDYSGAEKVWSINLPWTYSDLQQQFRRIYRPGLKHPLEVETFITKNTIEEAMYDYLEIKHNAILKLLEGLPTTEKEKEILLTDFEASNVDFDDIEENENANGRKVEVNPQLAKEYLSQTQKLSEMFGYLKEKGEKHFENFLENNSQEYAELYEKQGRRSYQANNTRVSATFLEEIINKDKVNIEDIKILDLASGPEMLKKHISKPFMDKIISLDKNPHYFKNSQHNSNIIIGSYLNIPLPTESIDYCNFGLSWDQTSLRFGKEDYERLEVLAEINRVLKIGGTGIISLFYSKTLNNHSEFEKVAHELGFEIVKQYTGIAHSGKRYQSEFITLKKIKNLPLNENDKVNIKDLVENIGKESLHSIKLLEIKQQIYDQRKIIQNLFINDVQKNINFNEEDKKVIQAEKAFFKKVKELKKQYGNIENIPAEILVEAGFIRYRPKKHYHLFQKLEGNNGIIRSK